MSHSPGDCQVCKKPLTSADDVVTCPYCGAPYHRECYQQEGHCVYQDRHGKGFEYKPAPKAAAESTSNGILCPECGTVNERRNIFCEKCGEPLHGEKPESAEPPTPAYGSYGSYGSFGGYGPGGPDAQNTSPPPFMHPLLDSVKELDGIPTQDWANFIGSSAPTYIYRLSSMERRKSKVSFMPSAFFLGPFYFAYRKMWGWAALSLLLMALFFFPQAFYIFASAGVALPFQYDLEVLRTLNIVAGYLSIGVQAVTGVFALQLFRMSAAKKLRSLRDAYTDDQQYRDAIIKTGGTSMLGLLLILLLLMLISSALVYTVGEEAVFALYDSVLPFGL